MQQNKTFRLQFHSEQKEIWSIQTYVGICQCDSKASVIKHQTGYINHFLRGFGFDSITIT